MYNKYKYIIKIIVIKLKRNCFIVFLHDKTINYTKPKNKTNSS